MSLRGCFFSSFASVASFAVKYLFLVFLRFSARLCGSAVGFPGKGRVCLKQPRRVYYKPLI